MPTKKPKVFISYSAGNGRHTDWIERVLATPLQTDGSDVFFYPWEEHRVFGEPVDNFLREEIINSDFVLMVCTPTYKIKAETKECWAREECSIITKQIYKQGLQGKIIPILRSGKPEDSIPDFISKVEPIGWADFTSTVKAARNYQNICKRINIGAFSKGKTDKHVTVGGLGKWVARTVGGVRQGVDYRRVDLGGPFKVLRVSVSSNSPYWRGGIKLEAPDSVATVPDLVHEKSLLFHIGGRDGKYAVSGYYDASWEDLKKNRKRPFVNTSLEAVGKTPIHIELAVHEKNGENLLFCKVLEANRSWLPKPPVVIPDKLGLLSSVYLVAWGDAEKVDGEYVLRDYEVEFSDLKFELWDE